MEPQLLIIGVRPMIANHRFSGHEYKVLFYTPQKVRTQWMTGGELGDTQIPMIEEINRAIEINNRSYAGLSSQNYTHPARPQL